MISTGQAAVNQQTLNPACSGEVYIEKPLVFDGGTTRVLGNSQIVPEPMTLSSVGAGLLSLGLFRRRPRK